MTDDTRAAELIAQLEADLAAHKAALADVVERAAQIAARYLRNSSDLQGKAIRGSWDEASFSGSAITASNIEDDIRSLAAPDAAPYAKVLEAAVEVVKPHKYPEKMRAEAALVAALAAIERGS